jgi:hypothetical protein
LANGHGDGRSAAADDRRSVVAVLSLFGLDHCGAFRGSFGVVVENAVASVYGTSGGMDAGDDRGGGCGLFVDDMEAEYAGVWFRGRMGACCGRGTRLEQRTGSGAGGFCRRRGFDYQQLMAWVPKQGILAVAEALTGAAAGARALTGRRAGALTGAAILLRPRRVSI